MEELRSLLQWLSTFEFHGIKPGLYRITKLLRKLGNPHWSYPTLHIAGTNGKGSTSAILESILHTQGFKVGLYTSPHLFRLNERFRINKTPIEDEKIASALRDVKKVLGMDEATYFELTTALAFLIFAEEKVDFAIIECGMGGRLDATNVIRPQLSIITSIGYDHMKYLGHTLEQIALEKAGIIKRGRPVILGNMKKEAWHPILERAKKLQSEAFLWGKDFQVLPQGQDNTWCYQGEIELRNLKLNLEGDFQRFNLGCALKGVEILAKFGFLTLSLDILKKALLQVNWPLRYQKIKKRGKIFLLDCAHNLEGILALKESLKKEKQTPFTLLIFGATNEDGTKPFAESLKLLEILFSEVYLCEFNSPRLVVTLEEWKNHFKDKENFFFFPTPELALKRALESPHQGVVVTGSIYLVSQFFKAIQELCKEN